MDNPPTNSGVLAISRNEPTHKTPPSTTQQPAQVEVDDSKVLDHYANFFRLSAMPEELLIDLGLNPQPIGATTERVAMTQRVIIGWHTAKRLLHVLQFCVERHETAFGVLETDVQKRVHRA